MGGSWERVMWSEISHSFHSSGRWGNKAELKNKKQPLDSDNRMVIKVGQGWGRWINR